MSAGVWARFKEWFRDPVSESFALRHKAIEVRMLAVARDRARMNGFNDEADAFERNRARCHQQWEDMAKRYEERFLSDKA